MAGPPDLAARWLGRLPYRDALDLQGRLVRAREAGEAPDTLLLLEHPPVITLGRSAHPEHVLVSPRERASRGIELHETGRGGDVTYHGPGQLVGYPIVALPPGRRDVRRYLRDLEEALILTAADHGVRAGRLAGLTGVWVSGRKLAAIGVRVSAAWVTSHGFALNVWTDLAAFDAIVPCGIRDHGVTSLLEETGTIHDLRAVAARAAERIAEALGLRLVASPVPAERLATCSTAELSSVTAPGAP